MKGKVEPPLTGLVKNLRRGLDLGRRVALARQGLCPWTWARDACIQLLEYGLRPVKVAELGLISRQWVHKWKNRFDKADGDWDALQDRPSTPHTVHAKRFEHASQVLTVRHAYPHYGAKKIKWSAKIPLSHTTIHRLLDEAGLVEPSKQRGKRKRWIRYQRPRPNDLWQLDITQTRLKNGRKAFIASIIDDHSRMILASQIYQHDPNEGEMVALVTTAIRLWGKPKQGLTDRGWQFHHANTDRPTLFTLKLEALGTRHIKASVAHPETLGKLERWHRSSKEEWLAQHPRPRTFAELRGLVASWLAHYNTERPHASLDYRTPLIVYTGGYIPAHGLSGLVNEVP